MQDSERVETAFCPRDRHIGTAAVNDGSFVGVGNSGCIRGLSMERQHDTCTSRFMPRTCLYQKGRQIPMHQILAVDIGCVEDQDPLKTVDFLVGWKALAGYESLVGFETGGGSHVVFWL